MTIQYINFYIIQNNLLSIIYSIANSHCLGHMIVDCNGRGLKLRDIRTGMCVKILIRGNEVRYPGYQYLYGAVGSSKYSVKLNGNPRQYNIVTLLYFPNNLM